MVQYGRYGLGMSEISDMDIRYNLHCNIIFIRLHIKDNMFFTRRYLSTVMNYIKCRTRYLVEIFLSFIHVDSHSRFPTIRYLYIYANEILF